MRESTVHHSLHGEPSAMGVPWFVIGLEMGYAAFAVTLDTYMLLAVLPIAHSFAKWMHQRDDKLFVIARKRAREKAFHFDPWHHPAVTNKRPNGYGKGLPC